MVVYKLHYFDVRHRAECIRMMFHYHGTKFEDIRHDFEKWSTEKTTVPFGYLPMLEIDDKKLGQSSAILRFMAKRFSLHGNNLIDQARADEADDIIVDFNDHIFEYLMTIAKVKEGDERKAEKDVLEPAVDRFFPIFRKLLAEHNGTYLAATYITYPDFRASDLLFTVRNHCPQAFDKYADLSAYINRVFNLSKLKKYIDARHQSVI